MPKTRRVRTVLLVGVAVLVWGLVFEGIARALLAAVPALRPAAETRHHADAYAGAAWARGYWDEFAASSRMRWAPYTYWRRAPYAGRYIRVDSAGVRASWRPPATARPPAGRPFRVWFFGGSTLWGTGARDAHTIPSEVARRLTARAGRPVEAVNFGESGYVSGQEIVYLQRLLVEGDRPDAVVFYDGINDSFAAFQSGHAGWPSNEANRADEFAFFRDAGAGAFFGRGLRVAAAGSGLGRLAAALTADRREAARHRAQGVRYPPEDAERLAADAVRVYGAHVRLAEALAAADSFAIRFYWQPAAFTKRALTPYEAGALRPDAYFAPFHARTVAALRASALVRAGRVRDLSAILDTAAVPLYVDFAHLAEAGNARVAAAIAADLAPLVASGGRP